MTLADKIVVLDAGRVAQVGKPLELYHYPADRFVAGFIGSPKMNFLPVKVTATAIDQVQVELPNRQQIWLPVESNNVTVGTNMSLGIRPEHLLPSHIADVTLEGVVHVVEQLGPRNTNSYPDPRHSSKPGVPPERRGVGRRGCHIRHRLAARALSSVP
ncbi:Maltose/maltodextrin import ATP-binding protein MalK [Kluyvera cryocrescens]|uniref:Maltose/maltodextrin import ATP-binding protein MalK n=1 Tax=Kluyvera cryocrescens TaxID=580 RepID=A0A485B6J0_KLUCR|nr:Maltose/maltodextrin import ATP-binding protein MalK [Kluyvera cryocrescens]